MVEDGGLGRYDYVEANLEVADQAAARQLTKALPWLRDAASRALYAAPLQIPGDAEQLDLEKLRSQLLAALRQVPGGEAVVSVQFTQILRGAK